MVGKSGSQVDLQEIECGEVVSIATMAEFHPLLMQALATKQTVVLNASHLERVDTAALQVLSAFVQDAKSQQQDVQWKEPSESLRQAAELLGLSVLLNLEGNPAD
jgi:phospholipid transport system transporter-binding protein